MTAGWVAASVRARAMTRRRLGRQGARGLAASGSLDAAVRALAVTPYGHDVHPGMPLGQAQRAVVATLVWNCRVLSGWVPRQGVGVLRVLLAGLEVEDVEDHLRAFGGSPAPRPYRLGALATAWPRLARTSTPEELRTALASSAWGDPGGTELAEVAPALRAAWADRVAAAVPEARGWAVAATTLLTAQHVVEGTGLPARARALAARVLGSAATEARTLDALRTAVPGPGRHALEGVDGADQLWEATARWWTTVEHDGFALVRTAGAGPATVVGAVALLASDAWRVRAALEVAARGGAPVEVLDAVA